MGSGVSGAGCSGNPHSVAITTGGLSKAVPPHCPGEQGQAADAQPAFYWKAAEHVHGFPASYT